MEMVLLLSKYMFECLGEGYEPHEYNELIVGLDAQYMILTMNMNE